MDNLARLDAKQGFGKTLMSLIAADGSENAVKPLVKFLDDSREAIDLRSSIKAIRPVLVADIAHFLCVSHGRHPGVIDHAATKIIDEEAREWLVQAIDAFAAERGFLNQITVAAGPITRQVGQEKITAVITAQANSFQMLATSDRKGCAAGAAISFACDWINTRPILEECAVALGIEPQPCDLPDPAVGQALALALAPDASKQRAMLFGAGQLLAQQRGLWQLIAARHAEMISQSA